jgi:hypothetical protein
MGLQVHRAHEQFARAVVVRRGLARHARVHHRPRVQRPQRRRGEEERRGARAHGVVALAQLMRRDAGLHEGLHVAVARRVVAVVCVGELGGVERAHAVVGVEALQRLAVRPAPVPQEEQPSERLRRAAVLKRQTHGARIERGAQDGLGPRVGVGARP